MANPANYQFVSITPAGGSTYLLHNLGGGSNPSVIKKAELKEPLDIAEESFSSNNVNNLPMPARVAQGADAVLSLTLNRTPAVRAFLRACKGKSCVVVLRESVAAIGVDNESATFNAMSNNAGDWGGTVKGGFQTTDVDFSVCDAAPVVYATA
jgi:hypothetical protein